MWKLLAFLALLVVVNAQFTVTFVSNKNTYDVDTWSNWIYVDSNGLVNTSSVDIDINAYDTVELTSVPFTLDPPNTRLTFTPNAQVHAFRVRYTTVGSYFLNFTKSDDEGEFADVPALNVNFVNRTFTFLQFPNPISLTAGLPSEPLTIIASTPPARDLTLTPQSDDTTITFLNAPVIRTGTKSGAFFVRGENPASLLANVSWTIQGDDERYYDIDALKRLMSFNIDPREITITTADVNTQLGDPRSNGINVFLRDQANTSFTVTPQAANTVFSPSSYTFLDGNTEAFFTYTTTVDNAASPKEVTFYTSGDGRILYELNPTAVAYSAPKRVVTARIGGQNVVTNRTYMSLTIPAPVVSSLVVSFTASNIRFNVSSVEFNKNVTSFTVEVTNTYYGDDSVYFALSGADAGLFADIGALTVPSIIRGNFIGPAAWYIPNLWVAAESDKIPIRASISPRNSVTLTPVASNVIFHPSSLTFRNGTEQQYFTITPLYNSVTATSFTTTVSWFINGTDHAMFDLPASFAITARSRTFQAVDSAHFTTAEVDRQNIGATRHLHKTYKIWTSVNYIGKNEHFSVTPTSPFYSFKPSVLFFNNKNTRIMLEATVTGIPASGSGRIDWVYGGQDGGLYVPASPDTSILALRPLEIVAAVVSPDERSKGVLLARDYAQPTQFLRPPATGYDPVSNGALSSYHVHSFKIRSFVLPDKSLTITPRCAHATFSPSKITIKGDDGVKQQDYWPVIQGPPALNETGYPYTKYYFNVTGVYLEANFSADAQASGLHTVWFELSGDDKDYYDRVNPISMRFNLVMRPNSEPYRASSSSFLLPSFVVVVAMAVLSLVM